MSLILFDGDWLERNTGWDPGDPDRRRRLRRSVFLGMASALVGVAALALAVAGFDYLWLLVTVLAIVLLVLSSREGAAALNDKS